MLENGPESNAKLAAAVDLYNQILEENASKFEKSHRGSRLWLVRTAEAYETALGDPQAYGAPDTTCTNEDGLSCLWWNDYHPGIQIHRLLGQDVAKTVGRPIFSIE